MILRYESKTRKTVMCLKKLKSFLVFYQKWGLNNNQNYKSKTGNKNGICER